METRMSNTHRWEDAWDDESRGWEDHCGSRRYLSDFHSLPLLLKIKSTVDKIVPAGLLPCLWQLGFSSGLLYKALVKP